MTWSRRFPRVWKSSSFIASGRSRPSSWRLPRKTSSTYPSIRSAASSLRREPWLGLGRQSRWSGRPSAKLGISLIPCSPRLTNPRMRRRTSGPGVASAAQPPRPTQNPLPEWELQRARTVVSLPTFRPVSQEPAAVRPVTTSASKPAHIKQRPTPSSRNAAGGLHFQLLKLEL